MTELPLYPLRFHPILRRYVWGGRRLADLGKPIGAETCAESWELCDRGDDQSVVAAGPLSGTTLRELIDRYGTELVGHAPAGRFPLLVKLLDTAQALSVQVHPDDRRAAALAPPDLGKTEAWIVLAAAPGSFLLAGLKRGFDRAAFARELQRGTAELCLARFEPRAGECFFIPAGLVHALGPGLLVAEIQQSSDVTFRLWDWNRVDKQGQPRPLHMEEGLAALDDRLGPAPPVVPHATSDPARERLVACDRFVIDRLTLDHAYDLRPEGRFHVLLTITGALEIAAAGRADSSGAGTTHLLPACLEHVRLEPRPRAVCLDVYLP